MRFNKVPKKLSSFLFLILFFGNLAEAGPNLVVHPVRLLIEKDQRSAQVDISNTGDQPATYRITLENKRMDELGKFTLVTVPEAGELFASDMVQFSPRQVELAPGTGQTVRISIRRPANLAPGEYRSHMSFTRIADANTTSVEQSAKTKSGEIGIVLTALVGISIPLIVRQGDVSATLSLSSLKLQPESKTEPPTLSLKIERKGNRSIYGDIFVNLITPKGEKKIGTATGVAVYSPNTSRTVKVALRPEAGTDFSKQKLRVLFQEQEQSGGTLKAEADLQMP